MASRSFLTRAAWTLAIVLAGYLLVERLRTPAPAAQPVTIPVSTTLAGEPQEPPAVSAPPVSAMPASELSPTAHAMPVATPETQVAASPSTPPTPDPAEALRAEQEQRIRSEVATAKAKAESLSTAANAECPDLKPGELRHPGAVSHCARLRGDAAQAVSHYEALKKQALAAGIVVQ
jgi:hypothetical protein